MSRITSYYRRALLGDTAAAARLGDLLENETVFICRTLITGTEDPVSYARQLMGSLRPVPGLEDEMEIRLYYRRQSALLCLRDNRESLPPQGTVPEPAEPDEPAELKADTSFPKYYLDDAEMLSEASQAFYFCMDKYAYAVSVLCFFCRFSADELSDILGCSRNAVRLLLSEPTERMKSSLAALTGKREPSGVSLYEVFDSIVAYGAVTEKKARRKKTQLSPSAQNTLSVAGIAAFAVMMVCITVGIFFFAFRTNDPGQEQESVLQMPEPEGDKTSPADEPSAVTHSNDKLYIFLTKDMKQSFEECGLSPEGFVTDSDTVSVFELVVIDPGAELISSSQLSVLFSDGTRNFSGGKTSYQQLIYQTDERTFVIRITAAGDHSPEDFLVALEMPGQESSVFPLPGETTGIPEIKGLSYANFSPPDHSGYAEPKQIIDLISTDGSEQHNFFYIQYCDFMIESITRDKAVVSGELVLYPLGMEESNIDPKDFSIEAYPEVVYNYPEVISDYSIKAIDNKDEDVPPYFQSIDFELTYSLNEDIRDKVNVKDALTIGSFVYSGGGDQRVTIAQELN